MEITRPKSAPVMLFRRCLNLVLWSQGQGPGYSSAAGELNYEDQDEALGEREHICWEDGQVGNLQMFCILLHTTGFLLPARFLDLESLPIH